MITVENIQKVQLGHIGLVVRLDPHLFYYTPPN